MKRPSKALVAYVAFWVVLAATIGALFLFGHRKAAATVLRTFSTVVVVILSITLGLVVLLAGAFLLQDVVALWLRKRASLASPRFQKFLNHQLKVLRGMGFFQRESKLTDEQLAEKLTRKIRREVGEEVGDFMKYPALVASLDSRRVYHGDMECDVGPGCNAYVEVLKDWSAVSRGLFEPSEIREEWTDDGARVRVRFVLDGKMCAIDLTVNEDWMDPQLPDRLNELIADTGCRFFTPDFGGGQDYILVVLNEEERERLRREAGWKV